jgi:hypothetical protein
MSRRVIQRTCKKLGAKKRVLQEQIDEVSAHPDDEIEDVSDVDALSMLEFIEHIFEYVFILILLYKRKQSLERRVPPKRAD